MKKLIAMVLVLTLVLSMGAFAFAVDPAEGYEDWSQVTINKELKITNNGTVNPGETFNFTIGSGSVTEGNAASAPSFGSSNFTITVAKDETSGTTNINLPVFEQVGVYTYPVKEAEGNTAGMIYDLEEYALVVTVINDLEKGGFKRVLTFIDGNDVKNEAFENEYSAGDLIVNKKIAGNYSDPNDEFEITVTITPAEGKIINAEAIVWNTDAANVTLNSDRSYTAIYTLKGDESFTIQNLPHDVTYVVDETDAGDYDAAYDANKAGDFDAAKIETTITNTRNTEINTGINLDNLPYVLILVGAAAGLVAFTIKRRPSSDE